MVLLTDRTSVEKDQDCQMSYWWYKHATGTGIVPIEDAVELADGSQIHAALQRLALAVDPIAEARVLVSESPLPDDIPSRERCLRYHGWVLAWAHYIEPRIRDTYETLMLEHELVLERNGLMWATTPDRVYRDKKSGVIVVDDYKSATSLFGWSSYWPYAIQVHVQLAAVQEELGEKVAYGRVRGLVKGVMKEGHLLHPYVWAHMTKDGEWSKEWKSGMSHEPVWDYAQGIESWVLKLGLEVAQEQFPLSQPIFLNERLLTTLFKQRAKREQEIASVREEALVNPTTRDDHFNYHFARCRPMGWRRACPYLAACHNATVNANPLASGLYRPRQPHHDLEIIGVVHEDT